MPPTRRGAPSMGVFQDHGADFSNHFPSSFMHEQSYFNSHPASSHSQRPGSRSSQPQILPAPNLLPPSGMRRSDLHFTQPLPDTISFSPTKHSSPEASHHFELSHVPPFNDNFFPPPTESFYPTDSMTKKPVYGRTYQPVAPKLPPQAVFNTYSQASKSQEKENEYPVDIKPAAAALSEPSSEPTYDLARYALGKHSFAEATSKNGNKRRKMMGEEMPVDIPEPEDMPPVFDEPDAAKPPFSYSQLIGMAILRAPGRKLTLASIYKWISDTFAFYKVNESGWTNSIRHNLSLSKSFYKVERPKDDPGKGNYWTITESDMKNFVKDRKVPKPVTENPSYFHPSEGPPPFHPNNFAIPPKPNRPIDTSSFPVTNEPYSDETVPESDLPAQEPDTKPYKVETQIPSSPPEADIDSSPPVARHTPPPMARYASHSRSGQRGHKRKRTADDTFRDSGFFSSLGSSALRPGAASQLFDETCRRNETRRANKGRAEEAIALMRSARNSSIEPSPSRVSKLKKSQPPINVFKSSPLRKDNNDSPARFSPDLQVQGWQAPINKALDVSPGTALQRHRDAVSKLLGTPASALKGNARWTPAAASLKTPAFLLHDDSDEERQKKTRNIINNKFTPYNLKATDQPDFLNLSALASRRASLSDDHDLEDLNKLYPLNPNDLNFFTPDASPLKSRTGTLRPSLQRAATAAGVLADVTNGRGNSNVRLASPFSFDKHSAAAVGDNSPLKKRNSMDPLYVNNLCGMSSDDEKENESIDMLKGFGKIGDTPGKGPARGTPTATIARPALGRSMTNMY